MNPSYTIEQFEDKSLSHYSYAIVSKDEMILIDPARDPKPYVDFAHLHKANIVGVIETHPHADFVSSHLEIAQTTGAIIYASKWLGAEYVHRTFDNGDVIELGNIQLRSLNTPGHSPDSICIVLQSEDKDIAVFTGDTLFIGDCGRPDLRENVGNITATRVDLAKSMYYSLRQQLMPLKDHVLVYPAHGAGTLCGKGLSEASKSTMGEEKASNWCLQALTEAVFVHELLADQPFIPKYFAYDVALNKRGAEPFLKSISSLPRFEKITQENFAQKLDKNIVVVDTRPQDIFKEGYLPHSFNIQLGGKFETWLGSILESNELFYLTAQTENELNALIERIAKIGYETFIKASFVLEFDAEKKNVLDFDVLDVEYFKQHKESYTIVDVRNASEVKEKRIFTDAIQIPLAELRERLKEIPTDKPILVHCAGGYRSAIGISIVKNEWGNQKVYDLGEAVKNF